MDITIILARVPAPEVNFNKSKRSAAYFPSLSAAAGPPFRSREQLFTKSNQPSQLVKESGRMQGGGESPFSGSVDRRTKTN